MYTVDVSANVPLYGQEQCNYCGAACGQMARKWISQRGGPFVLRAGGCLECHTSE